MRELLVVALGMTHFGTGQDECEVSVSTPDPDVLLALQSVFSLTYEPGRCRRLVDYRQPLVSA